MRKILYIIDKPDLYGSELHLLHLVEYLAPNCKLKVITFSDGPLIPKIKELNITVEIVDNFWFPSLKVFRKLILVVKKFNPDIIHGHQPKANLWVGIISIILRIKSVNTIHSNVGDTSLKKNNLFDKNFTRLFHIVILFLSELFSDKIIYVSETSRVRSFFKRKTVVVYNWVKNMPKVYTERKKINNEISILFVGSISILKGIYFLVDFLISLKSKGLVFRIDIIGNGDEYIFNQVRDQLFSAGVNAKFHGYVSNPKEYFEKADVFVSFSLTETFGIAFAEAASFGLPIFARELPVLKEILPPVNFLSYDIYTLEKKMFDLINDKELYNSVSSLNHQWAKDNFDFNTNVSKIEQVYIDLVK